MAPPSVPRSAPLPIPSSSARRSSAVGAESRDPCPQFSPAELRECLITSPPASQTQPQAKLGGVDPIRIDAFSPVFSPVFTHLPATSPTLLATASPRAQTLRRKLLRGATVLIVQAGGADKHAMYARLLELGLRLYILDNPQGAGRDFADAHMAQKAQKLGCEETDEECSTMGGRVEMFIPLDLSDARDALPRALDALQRHAPHAAFDAVTTYYEDAVALTARVADALGARTNPVSACEAARNKRRTREVMRAAGLPAPRFARVTCAGDVDGAAATVGFPAVLKPVFGAASMGVTRVDDVAALRQAYGKLQGSMDVASDTIWAQGTEMVLEEYYEGDEFDVDMLLCDGQVVYARMSDNWGCREPWFQETGMHCPSSYPAARRDALIKLAGDATRALGFRFGAFHVELRWTADGPRLIEVNGRLGGDPVREFQQLVWGVDLVEEHAMCALGIPIRPTPAREPLCFVAEAVLNAPCSGVVSRDGWLDFLEEDALVRRVTYFKHAGDDVVGPEDGVPDWLAEIIVVGSVDQAEVNERVRQIVLHEAPVPIRATRADAAREYYFPTEAYPFTPLTGLGAEEEGAGSVDDEA